MSVNLRAQFRSDVCKVFRGRSDQTAVSLFEFYSTYEQISGRRFPAPSEFGLPTIKHVFEIVGDICILEMRNRHTYVQPLSGAIFESHPFSVKPLSDTLNKSSNGLVTYQNLPPQYMNSPTRPIPTQSPIVLDFETSRPPNCTPSNDPPQQQYFEEIKHFPLAHQLSKAKDQLKKVMGNSNYQLICDRLNSMSVRDLCMLVDEVKLGGSAAVTQLVAQETALKRKRTESSVSRVSSSSTACSSQKQFVKSEQQQQQQEESDDDDDVNFISINFSDNNTPKIAQPHPSKNDPIIDLVDKTLEGTVINKQAILPKEVHTESDIETACKIIIQNMCANNEYVCSPKVETALLQYYNKRRFHDFNIRALRSSNQIPSLKSLSMKERRVNLYIEIFVKLNNVCTIYELERLLVNIDTTMPQPSSTSVNASSTSTDVNQNHQTPSSVASKNVSYESHFQMGPLHKNHVIYDYFKFPTDGSVKPQKLTAYDVATQLRKYLTAKNLWQCRDLQTADFLTYLAEELDVGNPWNIGVRIVSLPLLKSTLGRAQSDSRKEQDALIKQTIDYLMADIRTEVESMKKNISQTLCLQQFGKDRQTTSFIPHSINTMNTLKALPIVELLNFCYQTCKPLLSYAESLESSEQNRSKQNSKKFKMAELCFVFQKFFAICKNHPVAQAIFDLCLVTCVQIGQNPAALCESLVFVLDNQSLWPEVMRFCPPEVSRNIASQPKKTNQDGDVPILVDLLSDSDEEENNSIKKVTKKTVKDECYDDSEQIFEELYLQLLSLLKEAIMFDDVNGDEGSFLSLEQLEAIESKIDLKKYQKLSPDFTFLNFISSNPSLVEKFSHAMGLNIDGESSDTRNQNSCSDKSSHNFNAVLLKSFLSNCEAASSYQSISDAVKRTFDVDISQSSLFDKIVREFLEDPISIVRQNLFIPFVSSFNSTADLTSSLIDKNELTNIALNKISSLPLLKNIEASLNWNVLFRPILGNLSSFLETHSKVWTSKNVAFALINQSEVVKIPSTSSCEACCEEILKVNGRNFAALMVASVIHSGGINSFPFQLYQSEFFASFNVLLQRQSLATFITETLLALPTEFAPRLYSNLLKAVAQKVGFVDLDAEVVACLSNNNDSNDLLRLGMIGNLAGIQSWADLLRAESVFEETDEQFVEIIEPVDSNKESISESFTIESNDMVDKVNIESNVQVLSSESESKSNKIQIIDDDEEELAVRELECRNVIKNILSQEFGEGLQIDDDVQLLLDKHQERTGRSLERLSKELYSQDVHFILELVQNADDNNYDVDLDSRDFEPTLVFLLENNKLTVFNNEVGFKPENVRALCDVGKTTKGKHRKGLIGQKGIGFKSVFRVTDTPEIHSNGFHICFDARDGSLGMIKPKWIEPTKDELELEVSNKEYKSRVAFLSKVLNCEISKHFSTRIVLPFSAVDSSKIKTFQSKLVQIEPNLLLFLNKLEKIVVFVDLEDEGSCNITNENSNATSGASITTVPSHEDEASVALSESKKKQNSLTVMSRQHLGNNIICVKSKQTTQYFLVESCCVDVPEHLNVKLEQTEICFAFPLEKSSDANASVNNDSFSFTYSRTWNTFAFLPVREYGLKFIVQADFEIPSSRQDIDMDSPFNQWISLQIPSLLLKSFDGFLHILPDPVTASIAFLNFIPLPNETFSFFKPISQRVCELIKSSAFVPTVNGDLCLPSEAVHCSERILSNNTIDSDLFTKATGWKLAHKEFEKLRPDVVKHLGLHSIQINDLLITLEYVCTCEEFSDNSSSFDKKVETIKKLIVCIVHNFSHQLSSTCLSTMKRIPFIPLADKSWVSIESTSDLFSNVESDRNWHHKLKLLNLVNHQMVFDGNKVNHDMQKLLVKIGVKAATARELAKHHVSQVLLKKQLWSSLEFGTLIDYSVFLIELWSDIVDTFDSTMLNTLLEGFPVLVQSTSNSETTVVESCRIMSGEFSSVYFSSSYNPAINLPAMFPSQHFYVLSEQYLKQSSNFSQTRSKPNENIISKRFREFFTKLGVGEFFKFREIENVFHSSQNLVGESCKDFDSELVDILKNTSGNITTTQYKQLFTLLSHYWPEVSNYVFARVTESNETLCGAVSNSCAVRLVKSAVANALLESNWIPARVDKKVILAQSKDVFINSKEVSVIFRPCDVNILDPDIAIQTIRPEFVKFLGFRTSVTVDTVLEYLKISSEKSDFSTSLDHMAKIYQFLQNSCSDCAQWFHNYSLLYLPVCGGEGGSHAKNGFFPVTAMLMEDPSGLFDKYKSLLNKNQSMQINEVVLFSSIRAYKFLGNFFEAIGVPTCPSPAVYKDLMMRLISVADMTRIESKRENRVADLFNLISLSAEEIVETDVCIPCSNNKLASIEEDLLLADDQSAILYAMFEKDENLRIIHKEIFKLNPEMRDDILEKVLVGRYNKLSEAISENVIPGQLWTCSKVHTFVYFLCPLVQRYLKSKMRSLYDVNKKSFQQKLADLKFFACKEIEVIYTYKDLIATRSIKFIFCNGKEFYIGRDYIDDWNMICKELSTLFSFGQRNDFLALFLNGLVKYFNREPGCGNADAFLRQFDIEKLDDSDPKWSVSEPVYSQIAIDLEIRRNKGDNFAVNVEEMSSASNGAVTSGEQTTQKTAGPGQWPPLPPSRGGFSGDLVKSGSGSNAANLLKSMPPPPKPPNNWNATQMGLHAPFLASVEPNRQPGDNSVVEQTLPGSPLRTIQQNSIQSGAKILSQNKATGGTSSPSPGEKRPVHEVSTDYVSNNVSALLSPPHGSAEKKFKDGQTTNQVSSSSTSNSSPHQQISAALTPSSTVVNDASPSGQIQSSSSASSVEVAPNSASKESGNKDQDEDEVQIVKEISSVNLSVSTQNNSTFVSSVVCQLETVNFSATQDLVKSISIPSLANFDQQTSKDKTSSGEQKAFLVGRFGEQLVYNQLCNSFGQSVSSRNPKLTVHWVNERGEMFKPYDIYIEHHNSTQIDYIEVKSTTSGPQSNFFRISLPELKFATDCGSSYFMYFVFNALQDNSTISFFSNLKNKLETSQVSLLLNLHK